MSKGFETGAKIGSLTIICRAESHGEFVLICQCDCFQIVKVSETELKNRTACLRCQEKKDLKRFKPGDVAAYRNHIGEIAFGEQIIVEGIAESGNDLKIEYRGRIYLCRPGDVENLGINFYEKRISRNRSRRRNNHLVSRHAV